MKKYKLSQRNHKLICESLHTSIFAHSENKLQKSRNGQISIFIILGLVLLLSIGTYTYLKSTGEIKRIEQQRPVIEKAPSEFAPAIDFVTGCLYDTAKTAIKTIGEHGGYLDTSKISYNPFEPTEGEGIDLAQSQELELTPDSNAIIPYWWYLKSKNNCESDCEFATKRLPIEREAGSLSIEGQMDAYINENIADCLNEFDSLKKQGITVEASAKPQATTTVAKDDVFVNLKYPLTIKKADQTHKTEVFYAELPINFREIYDVATKVADLEANYSYIEKDVRELIDVFSRNDKNSMPPVSDLKFGFGIGTIWIKMEIEKKLQEVLTNYIQLLQVTGVANYKHITPPTASAVQDKELFDVLYNRGMVVPLDEKLEEVHPTLTVTHNYLDWWKPYVHIGGCRGQVCQAESFGNTFTLIFGIQRYQFAYDVSLPVLLEIKNPYAFKGEGYTFDFALEGNLRDNKPMTKEYKPLKRIAETAVSSMFCDEDKRFGGEINLTITDGRTKRGVNDAVISYSCGKTSCALGTTVNGTLQTKLPKCLGGVIGAQKMEYYPAFTPLDTYTGEDKQTELTLQPLRKINFAVKKYLLKKGPQWEVDLQNPTEQANDEQTLITMERKTAPYEEKFTTFAEIYGGPLSNEKDHSKDITIIPGTYDVKMYTIKYAKPAIIIPKEKRCFRAGIMDEKKCVDVPNESITFDAKHPLPNGGAEFELTITPDDLEGTKTIEWKTINFAIDQLPEEDRKIEDLDQLGKLQEYSKDAKEQLMPTFIR